jgi:hypothetical protein
MCLFMYSDCTNYVDPHSIITIFLMFWLYFMFFPYRWICTFMCSILAIDIFIVLFALFSGF